MREGKEDNAIHGDANIPIEVDFLCIRQFNLLELGDILSSRSNQISPSLSLLISI